jgi:hypothetical protein
MRVYVHMDGDRTVVIADRAWKYDGYEEAWESDNTPSNKYRFIELHPGSQGYADLGLLPGDGPVAFDLVRAEE